MDGDGVRARVMGWLGHAKLGGTEHLRTSVLDGLRLKRYAFHIGSPAASAARRLLEQQSTQPPCLQSQ